MLTFARLILVFLPLALIIGRAAADISLSLIALLFVMQIIKTRDIAWLRLPWVKIALGLWVYTLLISFFAVVDPLESLTKSASWVRFIIFAIAIQYWVLTEKKWQDYLLYSCLIVVTLVTLDTIYQYYNAFDIFGNIHINGRLTGPMSGPIVGIMITWLCFPLIAWCIHTRFFSDQARQRPYTIGLLIFPTLYLFAVLYSGERMALLLMLFGFTLYALSQKPLRIPFAITALLISITIGAILWQSPLLFNRQFASILHIATHFGDSPYGMIWQSAVRVASDYPFTGTGLDHFRILCQQAIYGTMDPTIERCSIHPHNIYLEWLVETGILGFIGFTMLIISWCRTIFYRYPEWILHPYAIGLVIAFIVRTWPLITSTSFFSNWGAVPFWFIIGWMLAVIDPPKQFKENTSK